MFFVDQVSRLLESFNIVLYSDTTKMINVKLCVVVLLIECYLFIPLSVTLIIFQGHSDVEQFQLTTLFSYPIKLKLLVL